MLPLLFSLFFCDFQFFLSNSTIYIDEFVRNDQILCVNVTSQYATIIFNTLGNSTYDIFDENYNMRYLATVSSYITGSGINMGRLTGSIEFKPIKDSNIRMSGVIFPEDVCDIKIVSNAVREYVYLNFETSSVCYFNGNGARFRYDLHVLHGVLEIRGPNISKILPYNGYFVVEDYSPLLVYKTNQSQGSNFLFVTGSNEIDYQRLSSERIVSLESIILDSNGPTSCSQDDPNYQLFKSLEDERIARLISCVALETIFTIIFFVYVFSLCCICPCCCCYKCCSKGCCCGCFTATLDITEKNQDMSDISEIQSNDKP